MSTKIVWNDCDGYIELDVAESRTGLKVDGDKLFGKSDIHTAIEVFKVDISTVPTLEDDSDEFDFTGFFVTETGNVYLPV